MLVVVLRCGHSDGSEVEGQGTRNKTLEQKEQNQLAGRSNSSSRRRMEG